MNKSKLFTMQHGANPDILFTQNHFIDGQNSHLNFNWGQRDYIKLYSRLF